MTSISEMRWKNDTELISIGPFHFKQWFLTTSGLIGRTIQFVPSVCQVLTTFVVAGDDLYIGDVTGSLQYWRNYIFIENIVNHENLPLDTMHLRPDL
jgi:hypothetical protein